MKQDVLETLEFDKIREKLAELAPSQLSKAMARTLMPSVEPEIIEKKLTETEEARFFWSARSRPLWGRRMTSPRHWKKLGKT